MELQRVATTTTFNGQAILDGTMGTANFTTSTYGNNRTGSDAAQAQAATSIVAAKDITVNGNLGSSKYTTKASDSAKTIAAGLNDLTANTGVTAECDSTNKGIKLTHARGADIVLANTNTVANNKLDVSTYKADTPIAKNQLTAASLPNGVLSLLRG